MEKNGFTLIEILAVIGIILLISLLLTPKVLKTIETNRTKGYKEIETRLKEATQKYILDNYIDPSLSFVKISKEQLINNNYIEEIKDLKDKSICNAYVELQKNNNIYITNPYLQCSNYLSVQTKYDFNYTGDVQTFTVPITGTYQIELWGASGGNAKYTTQYYGGKGAYTSGKTLLNKNSQLYIYVGGQGISITGTTGNPIIQYNGEGYNGGAGSTFKENNSAHGGGGGATDIRYNDSLIDRIMVAGGGGGASSHISTPKYSGGGGYGGKLYGGNAILDSTTCYAYGTGGSQTNGGNSTTCAINGVATSGTGLFGTGAGNVQLYLNDYSPAGGGGGYYGGGKGNHAGGGGGSSYISGYTGCVAVTSGGTPKSGCTTGTTTNSCSIHYTGKVFTDSIMKSGNESMPIHDGNSTMIGNEGNGYAKITFLGN